MIIAPAVLRTGFWLIGAKQRQPVLRERSASLKAEHIFDVNTPVR